jgi:hypothetical protein
VVVNPSKAWSSCSSAEDLDRLSTRLLRFLLTSGISGTIESESVDIIIIITIFIEALTVSSSRPWIWTGPILASGPVWLVV